MAKVLDTTQEEIYEPEDGIYVISGGSNSGGNNNYGSFENSTFNVFSEFACETMKKYIQKLEAEIELLQAENQSLKDEIKGLK